MKMSHPLFHGLPLLLNEKAKRRKKLLEKTTTTVESIFMVNNCIWRISGKTTYSTYKLLLLVGVSASILIFQNSKIYDLNYFAYYCSNRKATPFRKQLIRPRPLSYLFHRGKVLRLFLFPVHNEKFKRIMVDDNSLSHVIRTLHGIWKIVHLPLKINFLV